MFAGSAMPAAQKLDVAFPHAREPALERRVKAGGPAIGDIFFRFLFVAADDVAPVLYLVELDLFDPKLGRSGGGSHQ
jgi:hypothetical protein